MLAIKIAERISLISGWLADGSADNIERYRQLVGEIFGLRMALELSEQADSELSGD